MPLSRLEARKRARFRLQARTAAVFFVFGLSYGMAYGSWMVEALSGVLP